MTDPAPTRQGSVALRDSSDLLDGSRPVAATSGVHGRPGELRASISIPQGVALYVGAVLGAGVLLLPGLAAAQAGPSSLVAWGFDCLLGIPLALTFAALAARTPDAGGVLTYASRAFGGAIGTIIGWYYFFAAATAQALVALTGAYYAAAQLHLDRAGAFAIAAVILLTATAANLSGVRVSARLQLIFAAAIAALLLGAIVVSIPRIHARAWTPFAPHGVEAIGRVGVTIFFAFFGWEAISHLSEEFHDPARAVPRSTAISVAVISVLYIGVAIATVGTGTYGTGRVNHTAIARLLSGALGDTAGAVAAVIAMLISLGTANAFIAATSRLGYALSRDGVFPAPIGRLNANHVPAIAVSVVGGWALLCLLASLLAGWSADTLLVVPNSLVIIVYLSATLAAVKQFQGRKRLIAVLAAIMVCALIPFAGIELIIPAGLAALALLYRHRYGRHTPPASTTPAPPAGTISAHGQRLPAAENGTIRSSESDRQAAPPLAGGSGDTPAPH